MRASFTDPAHFGMQRAVAARHQPMMPTSGPSPRDVLSQKITQLCRHYADAGAIADRKTMEVRGMLLPRKPTGAGDLTYDIRP